MKTLVDSLHSPFYRRALLEVTLVGLVAGIVGVHVLLRRLPFFVVAMSHATFPGVVIASVAGFSLFVGGVSFGLIVVLAILALGADRALDNSSVIGVVLAGSFAIGVLILSSQNGSSRELSAFLVGSVLTVNRSDIVTTMVVGATVLLVLIGAHKELVLGAFDRTGARALGIRPMLFDAIAYIVVTVALVTAIPAVGTLLAIALLTVPALTARVWTDRLGPEMVVAAAVGVASGFFGLWISALWRVAAGGAIVLCAGAIFAISALVSGRARAFWPRP